jgi:hypothetical protein
LPYLQWRGVQKLVDGALDFPLSLILAFLGMGILSAASSAKTRAEKDLALLKRQRVGDQAK